jgi:hypothetical protein
MIVDLASCSLERKAVLPAHGGSTEQATSLDSIGGLVGISYGFARLPSMSIGRTA